MEDKYSPIQFYNTSEDYSLLWDLIHKDKQIIYFYDLYAARKNNNLEFVCKPLNSPFTVSILHRFNFDNKKYNYCYLCSQGKVLLNLDKTDVTKFIELCEKYSVVFILPKDL